MIQVVNVRYEGFKVYIGRHMPGFLPSLWRNPQKKTSSATAIDDFRSYFNTRIEEDRFFRSMTLTLREVEDLSLGCWCKPKPEEMLALELDREDHRKVHPCHGDIIAAWLERMARSPEKPTLDDSPPAFETRKPGRVLAFDGVPGGKPETLVRKAFDAATLYFGRAPVGLVRPSVGALAEAVATEAYTRKLECFFTKPAWLHFGRLAVPKMHQKILSSSSGLVAFWDGKSGDTLDLVTRFLFQNKPVLIVEQNGSSFWLRSLDEIAAKVSPLGRVDNRTQMKLELLSAPPEGRND